MQFISTQKVNCRDCHRCVRSCPVKAIGISQGHARVIDERCVMCGKCLVDCPQHAKQVESQVYLVKEAIAQGKSVFLSLAPSFPAAFPEYTISKMLHILRKLGFADVEETAVGAEIISNVYEELAKKDKKTIISACCPAVVKLVTKYYPTLVDYLAPVVSPMIVHGKLLKASKGKDSFIVFAGPCIGKFSEQYENVDSIDAVITFEQLKAWIDEYPEGKNTQPETSVVSFASNARYFPIPGGILKSFSQYGNDMEYIAVDGIENCIEVLESLVKGEISPQFIEMLACTGGCVGGPVSGSVQCIPARKVKVNEYIKNNISPIKAKVENYDLYRCVHKAQPVIREQPSEREIREILQRTSKFTPADEKDCGACGYDSCREKAIAVYQGLAETVMCVPYMKSKAESFANIIVENSPNAVLVVNEKMTIQELNPAAHVLFNGKTIIEKGISLTDLFDCTDFLSCSHSGEKIIGKRVDYPEYAIITEQTIIPVREHGLVIGIFDDVTEREKRTKEWQKMKVDTVEKVNEIINKQMHVAQEIAGLLGETTAETKSALLELIWLLKGRDSK